MANKIGLSSKVPPASAANFVKNTRVVRNRRMVEPVAVFVETSAPGSKVENTYDEPKNNSLLSSPVVVDSLVSDNSDNINSEKKEKFMITLTKSTKEVKGTNVIYLINGKNVYFPKSVFTADPPATLELEGDTFKPSAEQRAKTAPAAKLSPEEIIARREAKKAERASMTPEQRVQAARDRAQKILDNAAKQEAKLAAAQAVAEPVAEEVTA